MTQTTRIVCLCIKYTHYIGIPTRTGIKNNTRITLEYSQRPKQQRDTRPRNGLIVLMVLMLLKELSCPPGFQTDPK